MTGRTDKKITGAEALIRCLIAEGTEILFGYPGGAIMPVYDALYHYTDRLKHILVRHEQGAIHAAQGYARVSGKTGVVMVTSGPGAANLVTGLADALIDSTPVVCITGQVAEHLLGTDAFQEMDVINTTLPVTKWNVQITRAEDIPEQVARAFYIARSGRPGPVVIDLTKNAQLECLSDFHYQPCTGIRTYAPKPKPDVMRIKEAAQLINRSERPLILCGQGVLLSNATPELIALAEKAHIPIACTLLGLSAVPVNHPCYVGYLGMHGNYAPNFLTNQCDVLLAVGMRFDDRVTGNVHTYARQAKVIHIDIDKSELNKIIRAHIPLHADAKEALQLLLPEVNPNNHTAWFDCFQQAHETELNKVIRPDLFPDTAELKMSEVIRELSEQTRGKVLLVTDVGQHQMIASRYYAFTEPRTYITSGGAGTMGFALPAAIGACLARSDKQVVAVLGDGGFQMTLQELGTIMQYQIPVRMLILNNCFLGMVRQWQQLFFESRYAFTELTNPDFVALASAYGIPAQRVTTRNKLSEAISALLNCNTAYLLEVMVQKEENVFPMVPSGTGVSEMLLEPPVPANQNTSH